MENEDCPVCGFLDRGWRLDQLIHPIRKIGVREKYVTSESNNTIIIVLVKDVEDWRNTEV